MIHISPADASYPDWPGQLYPKHKPSEFDSLTSLAQSFDTLESNGNFYRILAVTMKRDLAARVSEHLTVRHGRGRSRHSGSRKTPPGLSPPRGIGGQPPGGGGPRRGHHRRALDQHARFLACFMAPSPLSPVFDHPLEPWSVALSSATPRSVPAVTAASNASSSMISPRATFTGMAPGFMAAKAARPIRLVVSGVH